MFDLLNSKEMQIADKETIDNGTPSILLMERAGKAIFNKIKKYINKEDEFITKEELESFKNCLNRDELDLFVIRIYKCCDCGKWIIDILED